MAVIALDLETTGVNVSKDRPVQISMVLSDGEHRRTLLNTLCDPGMSIPKEATAIHGITDEDVKSKADCAVACWQAEVLASCSAADALVTYNGTMLDVPIITRISNVGYLSNMPHVDMLDVAYRYFPTAENHRLGTMYKLLLGKNATCAHDALSDVMYTLDIFEAVKLKLQMTTEELVADMSVPRPYTIMPISKHKGKILSDVPTGFAKWLLQEGERLRPDLLMSMKGIVNGTV